MRRVANTTGRQGPHGGQLACRHVLTCWSRILFHLTSSDLESDDSNAAPAMVQAAADYAVFGDIFTEEDNDEVA